MSLCDRLSRVTALPMMQSIIAKKACLTAASSKERSPVLFRTSAIGLTAALALTACQRNPLKVTRNPCPAVAVPAYTGDVTLFSTPGATAADAIDTVATITNVRGGCSDDGSEFVTNVSFDVLAWRTEAGADESLTLPFFVAVVCGGEKLVGTQLWLGDVTLFSTPGATAADAIDTVATITNVRGGCSDDGSEFVTNVSFDVRARRNEAGAAESLTLPFFVAVVRGGDKLVAKQLGQVTVNFAEGQDRAQASGSAQSRVIRSAAVLPADIQEKITRERRPGDEEDRKGDV